MSHLTSDSAIGPLELLQALYKNTKKWVDNYLAASGGSKPTKVDSKAADPLDTLQNATAEELRIIMLAICEDDDAKTRVGIHLRVLRQITTDGATFAEADPMKLIASATKTELRAIGLGDETTKKRLSESIHVISIFAELHLEDLASQCKMS